MINILLSYDRNLFKSPVTIQAISKTSKERQVKQKKLPTGKTFYLVFDSRLSYGIYRAHLSGY